MAQSKFPIPDSFRGDWITPDSPEYDAAIMRWARNARRRAHAVAFVRDEADVVVILAHARANKLPIAIRCGGHNVGGASSVEGGIVIDLSRYIAGVRVDAEKRIAYIGGGALWETVDREGMKHGLATVGGTINHTGVGGLILGGGIGHLMGEHGHVVDNLVQVTIVTADGSILTTSEQENSELFWGVRGGGSNFGVVTEFVLKMHPQRRTVFCGNVVFPGSALGPIMKILEKWWHDGPSPKTSIVQFITVGPDGHPCTILSLFYNGSEEEGRAYFKALYDCGPLVDMAKEIPFEEVNGIQNDNVKHDVNYYMKASFVSHVKPEAALEILDRIVELVSTVGVSLSMIYEFFPSRKALEFPRDSTAFQRWDGLSTTCLAAWSGDDSYEKLALVRDASYQLADILKRYEDKLPVDDLENTGYGNYGSEELPTDALGKTKTEIRTAALFGNHYPRLQALKKKYDPEMVFNRWNPITPA